MKLVFLPHVREGIVPTATAGVRAQASVGVRLESPGRQPRDVSRAMTLLGPGDVVSIDPRQVLRVTPSSGTRDAEPEFFPSIEFDAPELPWSYSPLVPSGTRVLPWITLIVIEATSEVAIVPGQQGQSPLILRLPPAMASRELPDLADRWAWAHAQVACGQSSGSHAVAAAVATTPSPFPRVHRMCRPGVSFWTHRWLGPRSRDRADARHWSRASVESVGRAVGAAGLLLVELSHGRRR